MTLIYAERVEGWIMMIGDSGTTAPSGLANNPFTDAVIKVRLWHHNTILGFAGNVHMFNRFLEGPPPADFDGVIRDAVSFQQAHGDQAPDFLIAKPDGSALVRVVDGRAGDRPKAYIGSHKAHQRFQQIRTDTLPPEAVAPMLGLAMHSPFVPPGTPRQILVNCSAFHQTLIDNIDDVRGFPVALISGPGHLSYVDFVEMSTGNDLSGPEFADGQYAIQAKDAWSGASFSSVTAIGAYGLAFYSQGAAIGVYANIETPVHNPVDPEQQSTGFMERDISADDWFQLLADLHQIPIRARCPSATGHFGTDDRTFQPATGGAVSGPLAKGYRMLYDEP